jgi:hypothetical protein
MRGEGEKCYYYYYYYYYYYIADAVVKQFSNWFELFKFIVNALPIRKILVRVVTVEVQAIEGGGGGNYDYDDGGDDDDDDDDDDNNNNNNNISMEKGPF